MDQVTPGVDAAAALWLRFERDPLGESRAHGVVNPADAPAGDATGDDVLDFCLERPENFNFQAATWLPGAAFNPKNVSVNVRKGVPTAAIREEVPAEAWFGLSRDGILKTKHTNATSYKSSPKSGNEQ